mmetsp:Transcript_12063/g.21765  ORF Transcript_12063/g.21765 Transcript_12063/m.21765 type:complete len:244 (-) Transcript_12063:1201-1932(-)
MRASKEPCRFVWESFLLSEDDGSPIEGSPLTMSSTNLAAEAVRANCSSADSVLGISPLEASLAACVNCPSEDPDLCIVTIAFSVSGLTSISGGVDDMDTLCDGNGCCNGSGAFAVGGAAIATGAVAADILLAETAALPLALFILSANFPFGLYVDGGRNHGGVGGRLLFSSSDISSLTTLLTPPPTLLTMLKVVWLEDGTTLVIMEPVPMPMVVDTPGDLTRFVCATRSKNLRSNSLNSTRIP